jgi:hypothetical protein
MMSEEVFPGQSLRPFRVWYMGRNNASVDGIMDWTFWSMGMLQC